ncbi:MAG TPA: undecaprenyldiphospho-muramoylpentapeptide beta-N-acetylglucosaminyltransferase [Candidatus Cloacimonadota bacterium]|nr:undecaprenyldiphospho-muramoylpentapeptide beta-N-acetylglucosaminyltransferase [Candidatus Cloacimonadota bacterium]
MKVVIAAGGTGGHIIPALSITEALRKLGVEVLYIGNKNSMEQNLTSAKGIPFSPIDVQKLYRKLTLMHIKFPFKLAKSVFMSVRIMKEFKPDAFIGAGGFVSGPVGLAALLTGIPIYWQEQNSYPGITTRFIAKYAKRVFIAYRGALKYLPEKRCLMTGNPINSTITTMQNKLDYAQLGLNESNKSILILGGSQGSIALNQAILSIVDKLLENHLNILWQTGKRDFDSINRKLQDKKGIYTFAFSQEMGKIYNSADISIARAGALTLAELESKKVPMILIPLPTAAGNHQYFNAMEEEEKKVAKVIEQKNLNHDILLASIMEMLVNLEQYKQNFGESEGIKAADTIAQQIVDDLKKD